MKEVAYTVLQSVVSVLILFVLTRLMGKKQISQLSFFDYVIGISIGSIAANFASEPSVDYNHGITGMIVYALFPIIFSFLGMKSFKLRRFMEGTPSVLIQNGRINEKNLMKTKMTINDLLEECRLKNAFDISQIDYAILETNGKISLQMKPSSRPATLKDMNLPVSERYLCVNLIIDGAVVEENLRIARKSTQWLLSELRNQNISSPQQVLLAFLDSSQNLKCYLKNGSLPETPKL